MDVELFFDTVSPYSWLAAARIPELEKRTGARIRCVPVLLAGLLDAHGQKGPAEVPAKRAYILRDVARRAAREGLTFRGPPTHPFNPLKSLRSVLAVEHGPERTRYVRALMDSAWGWGEDLTRDEVIRAVAERAGLDGERLLTACQDPEIKAALKANTEGAVADGIFGVPTFRADGELFWGADRIADLRELLLGRAPEIDEVGLSAALKRGASARRA